MTASLTPIEAVLVDAFRIHESDILADLVVSS